MFLANKIDKFYYFVIVVFLATSAFPSFMNFWSYIPLLLPLILYRLFKCKNINVLNNIVKVIIILAIFSLAHIMHGSFGFMRAITFLLIMATFITFAAISNRMFIEAFIKVMKVICYISLSIWVLLILIPPLYSFLESIGNTLPQFVTSEWLENTSNPGVSLYFYYLPDRSNSLYTTFIRNCGPFYEPGLFASYIILALTFNTLKYSKLLHRDNIILILSLLSTCSSAGYLSFFLLIIYSITFHKNIITKLFTIILLLLLVRPVMNLDFMEEKVKTEMSDATYSPESRFGSMLYHYEKIVESPYIGFASGKLPETFMDKYLRSMGNAISPNGLTFVFVYWGIPLGILFYVLLYYGIKILLPNTLSSWRKVLIYIIVLSTAFSQTITTKPIFLLIGFLPLIYENNSQKIENRGCKYI